MSKPDSRRPFWRKRRWVTAAALWLAWPVLYALASGPTMYCACRWWIHPNTWDRYYVHPFGWLPGKLGEGPFLGSAYVAWWRSLGDLHDLQQQSARARPPSTEFRPHE